MRETVESVEATFVDIVDSPDANGCNLSFFFASLQSQQTPATAINGLVANITKAFDECNLKALNCIQLNHQAPCDSAVVDEGSNHFELPHVKEESKEREMERCHFVCHCQKTQLRCALRRSMNLQFFDVCCFGTMCCLHSVLCFLFQWKPAQK